MAPNPLSTSSVAATDPTAELMELRQPESISPLDHHDGGIRNVDADFHHRGGHQDRNFASLEPRHHRFFLGGFEPSVQQRNARCQLRKHVALQFLEFLCGRPHAELVGLLDEGADHEHLPPGVDLLPDEVIGIGPFLWRNQAGFDRLPPGRHLGKDRDVEVTEERQTEGARDRGCGHRQKVRGALALLPDRQALTHTEAVLLIDNRERQVLELDALLDQRVRSNEDRELSLGQRRQHRFSRGGWRAANQQPDVDLERPEDRLDDVRVLASQDLRRCQ